MTELAQRLVAVQREIEAAASRAKRDPAEVTLIAVSKRKPAADVVSAYEAGARHFGENYVQELVDKAPQVGPRPELVWHYIGHLQRNKANALLAVEAFDDLEADALAPHLKELLRVLAPGRHGLVACPPTLSKEVMRALLEEIGFRVDVAADAAPGGRDVFRVRRPRR